MAPPVITLSPTPPKQRGIMKVKFTPNSVVHLDWDPAGTPTSVTTDANGEVNVQVPATATSVIASDPNGVAASTSTVITP